MRSTFIFIISIVLICTLAACSYAFYSLYQSQRTTHISLLHSSQRLSDLEQNMKQLLNEVESMKRDVASMQNSVNVLNNDHFDVTIRRISQLLYAANTALVVFNDVSAATKLLQLALQILKIETDARFVKLQTTINSDINNLSHVDQLDEVAASGLIDNLIIGVNDISDYRNCIVPQNVNNGWLRRMLSLVFVVHDNASCADYNIRLIKQQFIIAATTSRFALYTHNQILWYNTIQNMISLISKLPAGPSSLSLLKTATQLSAIIVNPGNTVNIDQSLYLVNSYETI
jgi:hypothetical protein